MPRSDLYTLFQEDEEQRKLLLQEELILDVTEAIAREMEARGVKRTDLAERLGKTRGYVTQLLGGGRNLTLRTLADLSDALDCRVQVRLRSNSSGGQRVLSFPSGNLGWQSGAQAPEVEFRGFEGGDEPNAGDAVA